MNRKIVLSFVRHFIGGLVSTTTALLLAKTGAHKPVTLNLVDYEHIAFGTLAALGIPTTVHGYLPIVKLTLKKYAPGFNWDSLFADIANAKIANNTPGQNTPDVPTV